MSLIKQFPFGRRVTEFGFVLFPPRATRGLPPRVYPRACCAPINVDCPTCRVPQRAFFNHLAEGSKLADLSKALNANSRRVSKRGKSKRGKSK